MSCIYSTDEVHASTVCRKKVNTTDGEMIKINRAGAVSGYLKGIENMNFFSYFLKENYIDLSMHLFV